MKMLASAFSSGKRLLRNILLDLRYGAFLGGTRKTAYAHLGIQDTASTDYAALPLIFRDGIKEWDVLVDIGCGKGRVINWWLSRGFRNSIVGIELDETVAQATQRRLRRYRNVKIVCGDAISSLPANGTIFYLYNPFDKPWVEALRDRLAGIFAQGGKTLFYYNCVHASAFEEDPGWSVEQVLLDASRRFHPLAVIRKVGGNPLHDAGSGGAKQASNPLHAITQES